MVDQLALEGFEKQRVDCSAGQPDRCVSIADYLPHSPLTPVKLQQLVDQSGLDERTVRLALRRAVLRDRIPVVADNSRGYWIASTEAERNACVASLRRRAREIEARADALEKAEVEDG